MGISVVSASQMISDLMRQLLLNNLGPVSKNLIQNGSGFCFEPVAAHFFLVDFHASYGREAGVVIHRAVSTARAGEEVLPMPGKGIYCV